MYGCALFYGTAWNGMAYSVALFSGMEQGRVRISYIYSKFQQLAVIAQ